LSKTVWAGFHQRTRRPCAVASHRPHGVQGNEAQGPLLAAFRDAEALSVDIEAAFPRCGGTDELLDELIEGRSLSKAGSMLIAPECRISWRSRERRLGIHAIHVKELARGQ